MLVAAVLIGAAGFLAWSGVVVGGYAFDDYRDSQPRVYLTAGALYLILASIFAAAAFLIVMRLRRRA
jgi:hypothetical protein